MPAHPVQHAAIASAAIASAVTALLVPVFGLGGSIIEFDERRGDALERAREACWHLRAWLLSTSVRIPASAALAAALTAATLAALAAALTAATALAAVALAAVAALAAAALAVPLAARRHKAPATEDQEETAHHVRAILVPHRLQERSCALGEQRVGESHERCGERVRSARILFGRVGRVGCVGRVSRARVQARQHLR